MSLPRYMAYRDSGVKWLPLLPSAWTLSSIRHAVADIYSGGTPDSSDDRYWADDDSGFAWVAIGDMTRAEKVTRTDRRVTADGLADKRLRVLPVGTLLYSMYASLGKVAVLGIDAAINQAVLGLVPDTTKVTSDFLRYWLVSLEQHLPLFSSSNTQDNLNAAKVRSFPVFVPSLDEQRSIASFLDRETAKIDALVEEQERLMTLLREKRQAAVSHAVTKGLAPDAPMKPSGLDGFGEVPRHWQVLPLNRLVQTGRRITYGIVQPGEMDPAGRYMVRGQDYSSGWAEPVSIFRVSPAVEEPYRRARLTAGDIVMTIVGAGVGNVAVVPAWLDGANVTQTTARISIDPVKADPRFIAEFLRGPIGRRSVELYAKGAAQPGLNLEHVRIFPVTVPPLREQCEIANFLESEDSRVSALLEESRRSIELLAERRAALITAAVTGQVDVRHLLTADAA